MSEKTQFNETVVTLPSDTEVQVERIFDAPRDLVWDCYTDETLVADWLGRTRRSLPLAERRHLSDLSDQLARRIAGSLSREAGLYAVHEMMEALDPNYESDLARALMAECESLLDGPDTPE